MVQEKTLHEKEKVIRLKQTSQKQKLKVMERDLQSIKQI